MNHSCKHRIMPLSPLKVLEIVYPHDGKENYIENRQIYDSLAEILLTVLFSIKKFDNMQGTSESCWFRWIELLELVYLGPLVFALNE